MGVLRLTPDAFTDGSRSLTRATVAGGRRMISEGADIVEILCTPPHGGPPQAEHVASVVEALAGDVRVALATGSPELAAAAAAAGATLIRDDSMDAPAAGAAREALVGVAAETGAGWVAVQAPSAMSPAGDADGTPPGGGGIVAETLEALQAQADRARAAGVEEIYLDPGIGCGRAAAEDLDVLGGLERLAALGRPLVVGTGDGRLIDELHDAADARRLPVADAPGDNWAGNSADRLEGALVVAVWALLAGVAVLRTHHVVATVQAARVVGALPPVGTP